MKKAFTMAEALITMGIIGIVAAIILPAINQLRPDETKIKYLKAFDALQEATIALASNTQEYPISDINQIRDYSKEPLANEHNIQGSVSQTNNWTIRRTKICHLIAWGFGIQNDNCNASLWAMNTLNGNMPRSSFSTPDGIDWYMYPDSFMSNDLHRKFAINTVIDVNGINNGVNCSYSANCPRPDRFLFMIAADGAVYPADEMGQAYIQTRKINGRKDSSFYINMINAQDSKIQKYEWKDTYNNDGHKITTKPIVLKPGSIPIPPVP